MVKKTTAPIPEEGESKIDLFRNTEVGKVMYKDEWWLSVTDVVASLTDSSDPSQYLKRLRQRDPALSALFNSTPDDKGGGTSCTPPYAPRCDAKAGDIRYEFPY